VRRWLTALRHKHLMTTADDGDHRLEWTGERYVPELPGNIRLEHVHRYLLARELVKDRRVLDIACGEGYGADLLAGVAATVVAVDIAPDVLTHGFRRYRQPHLRFVAGGCTAIPIVDHSVDVVVSFETLEHLDQHDAMMREVKRVLSPDGFLIISSPDRREYSDVPGYQNPFHVRELYRDEFERLLASHFRSVALVGQRVKAGSVVGPLDRAETAFLSFDSRTRADKAVEGLQTPLYLIGVATDGQLPRIPTGLLDGGEFVWSSDHVSALRGLQEQHRSEFAQFGDSRNAQEAATATLRAELERHTALVTSLAAERARAEERTGWLQEEIDRRGSRITELDASLAQVLQISNEAHKALEETRKALDETRKALDEARTQIGELQLARGSGEEREADLTATISALQQSQAELAAKLDVIETSHSWRLTAPLRGVRRLMKSAPAVKPKPTGDRPINKDASHGQNPDGKHSSPHQPIDDTDSPPVAAGPSVPAAVPVHSERPSIVVVSHDAHFYGAQRVALFLAQTLSREMGYDVDVLLCGDGPLRTEFAAAGQVHEFFSAASTPEIQREIIGQLYGRGARIALCNTSCVGGVVHELKAAGFTVISLIHELPGLITQYGLEDSIATIACDADKVVFAAGVVRDRFVELTGMASDKAVVRPQGLLTKNRYAGRQADARRGLRTRLGLDENTRIVLAVGSAHHRKGPDLFVETGLSVMDQRRDVAFVWVGHKDGDGFADAWARVSAAGAEANFHFPGVIEDSDVFFAGSDVYLLTSREDPFPSVVLHALDAELPVIGFDNAGGFVELLRRDCGILVPYLDTGAMAAAVLQVLSNPTTSRRMTSVGKDIVSREFEFIDYVRDLVSLAQGPRVSVIVPNYNYAHYLPGRLRSILTQTYRPTEIIFLDDCSSDESLEVASTLLGRGGIPFRIISNESNQGVYHQWLRGIAEAIGELVWIAEADDDCSPRLLETLVPTFANSNVVLAYTQSTQVDDQGREIAPDYLGWTDDVHRTKWRQPYVRPGVEEIRDSLIIKNTIPNVSAVLMRKPNLAPIEAELLALRNAGDWLVYIHLLERGDLAFIPESLNYHRRHGRSVTIGRGGLNLMRETLLVQRRVLDRHSISPEIDRKRKAHLQSTYEYLGLNTGGPASYKDHEALRPLTVVAP
jgi:glycosyltransferase involved in cell wall biosynthesis/SAM-dependent methyltransferase